MSDKTQKQFETILREFAQYAGTKERTSMYPGAEVIDAAFSADRITVRGRQGYYEPALTVPGVTYSNGDLVTVLYVQGAEPIAIAQSPGSSGNAGWPFNIVTVDATNTAADYSSLETAFATEAAGTAFAIGPGEWALTANGLPDDGYLFAFGRDASYRINSTYTVGGQEVGLPFDGDGYAVLTQVWATDASANDVVGIKVESAVTVRLDSVYSLASNTGAGDAYALYVDAGSSVTLEAGRYQATVSAGAAYGIYAGAAAVVRFEGCPKINGDDGFFTGAGTFTGVFQDADDVLYHIDGVAGTERAFGWPFGDELTVDPSDPAADHTTVALAVAAAAAGDCVRIGAGVHTVDDATFPAGVDVRGSGKGVTILRTTTQDICIRLAGSNNISDLTVENNKDTASTTYGVYITGAGIDARDVRAIGNNPSGSSYPWHPKSTTAKLTNCEGYSTGGGTHIALYTSAAGTADVEVEGGKYEGDDSDIDTGILGDTVTLNDPTLENGTINAIAGNGTVQGSWCDTGGNLHFVDEFVAANTHAFKVKNTSGGTVALGDVGYIDENTEYKETTTAYSDVDWCVVVVGGANNADIHVTRRGLVTVTLNGNCSIGDKLYTSTTAGQAQPLSYVRPEMFAIARTANAAGAGGTCVALLYCARKPVPLVSDNLLFYVATADTSDWQSTCNGAPVGAVVAYNAPLTNGAENTIVPASAGQLANLVLHNTTRAEEAYISSVNIAANTITVTAAADVAAWANLDVIEVRSQTNTAVVLGGYFFDLDVTSTEIPALTTELRLHFGLLDSGGANQTAMTHPYEANSSSKQFQERTQVANVTFQAPALAKLINRRFCLLWLASGAGTYTIVVRVTGVVVASP